MFGSNTYRRVLAGALICFASHLISHVSPVHAQQIKWMKIGSLHSWYRSDGAEIEVGRTFLQADQQDGLRWPAQFRDQDNAAAKALWIGAPNYTDAPQYGGLSYAYKVVHIGPRGFDTDREFMPQTFQLIGRFDHPQVFVDGLPGSDLMFSETLDEIDPNLPADRVIHNIVNTSMGITLTRRIYAFAQQFHDNYFIYDYTFTNTGNVDPDPDIELPGRTLADVYFYFQYRYAVSREGADLTGLNSPRWGHNEMLSTRGEAKRSDGSQYPGDYEDWLNGVAGADSLRCQFAWMGRHSGATYDLIGVPDVENRLGFPGRFTAPQFAGNITLHADRSTADSRDDPQQPTTTSHEQSDDPPTRPNDQFNAQRMSDEWIWMTKGHRLPRHDERVGTGNANVLEGTPGGFSNTNGYGPYTLGPGDSIRIVIAEGVNGLNRQQCIELGQQWFDNVPPFTLPNGTTTTDRDVFKNAWVFTGIDSLFQSFGRARRNFNSNFQIPQPPPPPEIFEVNSGGDRIALSWANNAESWPGFAGYRVFRAIGQFDTTFTEVFACGRGTANPQVVNSYDDVTAVRGQSYYYYVASFDDGSKSNGTELRSSLFWTRTIEAARLKRQAKPTAVDFRVVPNPYYITAAQQDRQFVGEPDRIFFLNLPGRCTIKIFTERGDLVKTIEHTDGSGDEFWISDTEFRQIIVSGIYIAVVQTPEGEQAIQKFIVIR